MTQARVEKFRPGKITISPNYGRFHHIPQQAFHYQRLFEPDAPSVNSEFYPGWLDHWGEHHHRVSSSAVASALDEMLGVGASVNMYMAHGGTSFGFGAGANAPPFQPENTSYDYDAPISEAGDLVGSMHTGTVPTYTFIPIQTFYRSYRQANTSRSAR